MLFLVAIAKGIPNGKRGDLFGRRRPSRNGALFVMKKSKSTADNGDYEYERTKGKAQTAEPVSQRDQSLDEARKALFELITVQEAGKSRTRTVFEVFVSSLSSAVSQGDTDAMANLDRLEQHHQKRREANRKYLESPIRKLEAKLKPLAAIGNALGNKVALQMAPCIARAFEKVYGPLRLSESLWPYYLDMASALRLLKLALRRSRGKNSKADYEVGRGKPPTDTRFTSERNPRRKAKPADVWSHLEKSLNTPVVVNTGSGKKITTTRRAVGYKQLFRDAIRGKRRARAETRKIILRLDEKGLLSPPERPRRRTRKARQPNAQLQMMQKVAEVLIAPSIKRDMVNNFTRRFGPVPDFVTDYERRLPALKDVAGWAEFQAARANKAADGKRSKEAARRRTQRRRPLRPGSGHG